MSLLDTPAPVLHALSAWRLTGGTLALARFGAALLLLITPFQLYLNPNGAPLATGYILIVFLGFLLLLIVVGRRGRFAASRLYPPLALMITSIVLASMRSAYLGETMVKILHFSLQIAFYLTIINVVDSELLLSRMIKLILLGGVLSAMLGITLYLVINVANYQQIADVMAHGLSDLLYGDRAAKFFADGGYYSWIRPIPGQLEHDFRATSLFVSPGENAFYSCVIFLITIPLHRSLFRRHRILHALLLTVLLLNILLAQVRAVWLGLAIGIFYYLVRSGAFVSPKRLLTILFGLALSGTIAVAVLGVGDIVLHAESLLLREDSSAISRLTTMQQGLRIVSSRAPVIGVGPGSVRAALGLNSAYAGGTTHSLYLDTAVATGSLGLLAYLWLMARSYSEARFAGRNSHSLFLRDISLGFQSLWLSLFVIQVFQGNLFGNPKTNIMLWGLIALISVSARLARRVQHEGLIEGDRQDGT